MNKFLILISFFLYSFSVFASDFTIQLQPAPLSVGSAQVSSVSAAKIDGLQPLINASVPVGTVVMFAGSTPPSGWLLLDGSSLEITQYTALYAIIGSTYGSVDGQHFNLPDTRGIFVKGSGSQSIGGVSYSGVLGTKQNDQFQSHLHLPSIFNDYSFNNGTDATVKTGGTGVGNSAVMGSGAPISHSGFGTVRAGSETRPANISLNYIIKH